MWSYFPVIEIHHPRSDLVERTLLLIVLGVIDLGGRVTLAGSTASIVGSSVPHVSGHYAVDDPDSALGELTRVEVIEVLNLGCGAYSFGVEVDGRPAYEWMNDFWSC